MNKFTYIIVFTILSLFLTSCFFRNNREINRISDKEIKKSTKLQALDKVCRELPLLERVQPEVKRIGKNGVTIFYYYDYRKDFKEFKTYYKQRLSQKGWVLVKEEKGIIEEIMEFKNEKYLVHISYGNFGDSNYVVSCQFT